MARVAARFILKLCVIPTVANAEPFKKLPTFFYDFGIFEVLNVVCKYTKWLINPAIVRYSAHKNHIVFH